MALVRIKPSHPDFKKLSTLSEMIAVAKNPHVYHVGHMDMDDLTQQSLISVLEDAMQREMNFEPTDDVDSSDNGTIW